MFWNLIVDLTKIKLWKQIGREKAKTNLQSETNWWFFPIKYYMTHMVKNLPAMQETLVRFLGHEVPWITDRLPTPVFLGFPGGSAGKESSAMWETWVWSLGWEDPLEKGMATLSSILAWRIPVHGVTKSQAWLRHFHMRNISISYIFYNRLT